MNEELLMFCMEFNLHKNKGTYRYPAMKWNEMEHIGISSSASLYSNNMLQLLTPVTNNLILSASVAYIL